MGYEDLFVPGTELTKLEFENFWDWLIRISDLRIHWKYEPTYLLSQFNFLVGGIITFVHAFVHGGRLPYLWFTIIMHALMVESISYFQPDVDNFWHSQTPIMLLGRRLPLHIIFLYCIIYQASIGVAKMKLPNWAEPFAVGLLVVLIDIPYDIVSVKFLHWTWHDTDPNIGDRHYWVPWTSYYFHATFTAGLIFWFHFTRRKLCTSEGKWIADERFIKELLCSLLTALLGAPTGILLFIAVYHPLHDIYNIHSEVTFFVLFTIFLLIVWSCDRQKTREIFGGTHKTHWTTWLAISQLVLHYATFLIITLFFNPEDEISTGMKEPLGPCEEYVPLRTALGMTLRKRKYLCPTDYNEEYFDWGCLPDKKHPSLGSIWYTTCGVPFSNRAEYIVIVSLLCIIATVVFRNLHFKSNGDMVFEEKSISAHKKNK